MSGADAAGSGATRTGTASGARIPAFVNAKAGTADAVTAALAAHGGFDVQSLEPAKVAESAAAAAKAGAARVVVAGGDGTIAAAFAALAETDATLAVMPGGTLNHFARAHGIPEDLAEAATLAATGTAGRADVGYVNDRLFVNTSAVGAYVLFVRARDRLERYLGYHLATLVAGLRVMLQLRTFRLTLKVDGEERSYDTPLVFIGVGEREIKVPALGARVEGGKRGLHVLVVQGRGAARLFALAMAAATKGVHAASKSPLLDAFIVDEARVEMRRPRGRVAVDGEIVPMVAPLHYRHAPDGVRFVRPAADPVG